MAPKGQNSKKEAGRARKEEKAGNARQVKRDEMERKEAAKWEEGARGKSAKEEKEEKRRAALAAKAERDRLLAEEEATLSSTVRTAPKAGQKKQPTPVGPGAISDGGGLAAIADVETQYKKIESFAATGIDATLELMEVVTAKTDKASVGQQAAGIERHPERRFKAAFEAYLDRELQIIRRDNPGLRLQQSREIAYKQFQKSSENPFNQAFVVYDATKEERLIALEQQRKEVEDRHREVKPE